MKRWLSILLLFLYLPFCYGAGMELHHGLCRQSQPPAGTIPGECNENGAPAREHIEQQLEVQWGVKERATVRKNALTPAAAPSVQLPVAVALSRTGHAPHTGVPRYIRHCAYLL